MVCSNDCGIVMYEYAAVGNKCPKCGNGAIAEDK